MPTIFETTDAAANTGTTYTLGLGQTAQGHLTVGDADWYRVSLVAGHTYTFAEVGTGHGGINLDDPFMYLRDGAGNILAGHTQGQNDPVPDTDDAGPGYNSAITFTATTTGTYYIDAGSYALQSAGQYGISFIEGSRANFDEEMGAGNLLRIDASWSTPGTPATITWGVRATFANSVDSGNNSAPFSQLSPAEVAAVQAVLAHYSEVAQLTFNQVSPGGTTDSATMLYSNYSSSSDAAGAYAVFPVGMPGNTGNSDQGDVRLNIDGGVSTTDLHLGSYSFQTILHETGHALGLPHPGDYNAGAGGPITYDNSAQFIQDSHQYTVMSYFDESATGAHFQDYPQTLMMFDILAVQELYGANYNTRSGNTIYGFGSNAGGVYNFATNQAPALCIWDGGGIDTLNVSGFSQASVVNLGQGTFSSVGGYTSNVSIAFGAIIENATTGNGADTLVGNSVANVLNGGAGADTMRGLSGNDIYVRDNAGDVVDESVAGSGGFDTVQSALAINLSDAVHFKGSVEGATLTGAGNVNLTGNALANTLVGNSGNNVLNGLAGADTMRGLAGNDTYYVDNAGDVVDELTAGSAGTDTVVSALTINLADAAHFRGAIEVALLTGAGNVNAIGNGLANTLIGNGGNNILNGMAGADFMRGLAGNDAYIVDNAGDVVDENAAGSGGIDTVQSALAINLSDAVHFRGAIEAATLTGSANVNAIGNALANTLIGNAGNNVLNGMAGADTMQGLGGNDIYYVDNAGDVVNESVAGSGGYDVVRSTLSINLSDTVHFRGAIEAAQLIGTANVNAIGNGLANTLIGNAGNNILNGLAGADMMRGGGGNDIYVVDNVGDVADESAVGSDGYDSVRSALTINLSDAVHFRGAIEAAQLIGTANVNAFGNGLANTLVGNGGNNVLNGMAGADTMQGLGGNDIYYVDNAGDVVNESVAGSGGYDIVRSTLTVNLSDTVHFRGAIEAAQVTGAANVNAIGNALANTLIGNAGANILNGMAGNDTLTGLGGNDIFLFNTALNAATNVDAITDFSAPDDTVWLDNAVFTALGAPGVLAASAFHVGATATAVDQHVLYANATGALFYDADGSGAGAAVHFATVAAGLLGSISNVDFVVV